MQIPIRHFFIRELYHEHSHHHDFHIDDIIITGKKERARMRIHNSEIPKERKEVEKVKSEWVYKK